MCKIDGGWKKRWKRQLIDGAGGGEEERPVTAQPNLDRVSGSTNKRLHLLNEGKLAEVTRNTLNGLTDKAIDGELTYSL